jgi:hypothetical protein
VRAWAVARVEITDAVTTFAASCRVDRRLGSSLRVIERTVERVDRQVASYE